MSVRSCIVHVTIFITKFHPLSNFTVLHALTQAACSWQRYNIWPHNEDVDWSYSNLCLENSRVSYYKLGCPHCYKLGCLLDDWLYELVAYGPRCLTGDNWCVLIGQFQAPFQPYVRPSDWADPAHWLWRLFWGCHDTGEVPWEDPLPTDTHAHQCHGGKAHTHELYHETIFGLFDHTKWSTSSAKFGLIGQNWNYSQINQIWH